MRTWSSDDSPYEVVLYEVRGGGHTLPGGEQYLPERIVGRTCGDFEAAPAVWRFLSTKRR